MRSRSGTQEVSRALEVLLSDQLEPIVEMVLRRVEEGRFEASSHDGSVCFTRRACGPGWSFGIEEVVGSNPLLNQEPGFLPDLASELASLRPNRSANSYPFAFEQVAQLFDHPSAPDLCVIHTAAHNWEDQGGHLGEHGSLDLVQARAPFVAAGSGVRRLGRSERACMLVDLAPTILCLLGAAAGRGTGRNGGEREGAFLAHQDGEALLDIIEPGIPSHVVCFLMDGCNSNVLLDLAERGGAPNLARLMSMGTTFRYGAVSSLPTVTLSNHTAILTGCFPGHHGILHNAWYDRAVGEQVVTNSPETWASAMRWLWPGVETVHSALRRSKPGAVTVSINEPCDAGASYSTFDVIRSGGQIDPPPPAEDTPRATARFVRPSKDYRWSTRVDHTAVEQFRGIWSGSYLGIQWPRPAFTWVNFTLTDAAFHEGGPYSEVARASVMDTDSRIGDVMEVVDSSGAWDETAFFVVADHGMEETDPEVRGDWGPALRRAGLSFRDEGYGFVYLDP